MLPRKTTLTLLLLAALLGAMRWIDPVKRLEPAKTPEPKPEVTLEPKVVEPKPKPVWKPLPPPELGNPVVEDPAGSMSAFYAALKKTEAAEAGAITRVVHYGDSPTTADSITADVRALLQERFGDAGHGFVLISKPWAWYGHRGIGIRAKGWKEEAASQGDRAKDRLHGLGGVACLGSAGATSTITLPDTGHKRVEVQFLRQPAGGDFKVESGDQTLLNVSTGGEEKSNGFTAADLPPGAMSIKITVTQGKVRIFGVWFEKAATGVTYSSLGLNGAGVQTLLRFFEPVHWKAQLQHQQPHLVVLNYGSNEADFGKYIETAYPSELKELIRRVQDAAPKSSILVMGPMDRGMKDRSGDIVTMATIPKLIDTQRRVAAEMGVAFFDTYRAMGGSGTMARWYLEKPRMVAADYLHPTPGGAAKVGALLNQALLDGFEQWKAK